MKKVSLFVFLAALTTVTAAALTLSNESYELTLHEQSGRFSLYAVTQDGTKTSLFVKDDPRTTILTVLAGSNIYRMGDSFQFRQTVKEDGNSASFVWTSSSLVVTEKFSLEDSFVTISVTVENISERQLRIGVRYLLDTYLGEKRDHFSADGLPVEAETDYVWATPYEIISSDGESTQLVVSTTGAGISEPDRIVLANWKRLSDANWDFEANQDRDFSLLPYSINDSAVAMYYEPQQIPSKTNRTVTLKLSWEDPSTVVPASDSGGTTSRESGENQALRDDIRAEMVKIDSLIIQIDSLIETDESPSDSAISEIESSMNDIEERKEELTGQQQ